MTDDTSHPAQTQSPDAQKDHLDHENQTHLHHHDHHGVSRTASRKALLGALSILGVFFVVEVIGGYLTHSLALLSDAFHLLTDVAAIGLALFAQRFARRRPSKRRSFGYHRVEIIAALFNGLTLWVVAVFIVIESVDRFWNPVEITGGLMTVIAVAGMIAQGLAALILAKASGESLNVKGAYVHALTDAVQSIGVVLAGLIIVTTGFVLVDPIVSLIISLMIIWSGGKIVVEAVHVLLEGTPPEIDLARVVASLCAKEGVGAVTDIHAWSLTSGYNALSAHVVGVPNLDAQGREALADTLAYHLKDNFAIHHLTIQVEKECSLGSVSNCNDWMK